MRIGRLDISKVNKSWLIEQIYHFTVLSWAINPLNFCLLKLVFDYTMIFIGKSLIISKIRHCHRVGNQMDKP